MDVVPPLLEWEMKRKSYGVGKRSKFAPIVLYHQRGIRMIVDEPNDTVGGGRLKQSLRTVSRC